MNTDYSQFYFGDSFQDAILANMVRNPEAFLPLGDLVLPEYFNGLHAMQACSAMRNFIKEHNNYPTFEELKQFIYTEFPREEKQKADELLGYLVKLESVEVRNLEYVVSNAVKFARERALINATRMAAMHIKDGTWPEEGFAPMFEEAYRVGNPISEKKSYLDYDVLEVDASKTILGDRFLCVEGILLFIAPSGVGKSSASVYQDIMWSCGRTAFGIKPAKPLKIVTFQGEDDDGDLTLMTRGVIDRYKLSEKERELVQKNTIVVRHKTKTGEDFLNNVVAPRLHRYRPDLIRLNPLNCYLGGDPSDAKLVTKFFRNDLNSLLERYKCAAIVVHHTPKTNRQGQDKDNWRPSDWMYAGAGNGDMVNCARAVLVIEPTSDKRIFKFIAAKRGSQIGWKSKAGDKEIIRYYQHNWKTDGTISHWSIADEVAVAALQSKKGGGKIPDQTELLRIFSSKYAPGNPETGLLNTRALDSAFKQKGWSRDGSRGFVDQAVEEGWLDKISLGIGKTTLYGRPEIIAAYRGQPR